MTPDRRTEMVQDCLSTLHAIVKDPKQPATARQQATRTLLEALGVVGARATGEKGAGVPAGAPAVNEAPSDDGLAALTEDELRRRLKRLRKLGEEAAALLPVVGSSGAGAPTRVLDTGSPLD